MAHYDAEEEAHYTSVLSSFKEYERYVMREMFRRKKSLQRLSASDAKRLSDSSTLHNLHRFINAIHSNQKVLDCIADEQLRCGPSVQLTEPGSRGMLTSPLRHLLKLKSTIHQFGEAERRECYLPILTELEKVLPVISEKRSRQRVLVPGAGLGRLALEIAAKGYVTQGNEFSYQMLFASNFILNCTSTAEEFTIHPWIHNPNNNFSINDALRPIRIPDVLPSNLLAPGESGSPDFSMCAGEFLQAYKNDHECWDCIVTCFFIDAAPNVIKYIKAFERLLRPGGVWVNLGPLLYHWHSFGDFEKHDDERYKESIELSYEEIKDVMASFGFKILREQIRECGYTTNIQSMMRTTYRCTFFTALKEAKQ